jgi:hypothetical protein
MVDRLISQQHTPPEQIPKIVRQPETRPISEEQLTAEVKGIYAGLVMVEGKCIQVDARHAALAREAPPAWVNGATSSLGRILILVVCTIWLVVVDNRWSVCAHY